MRLLGMRQFELALTHRAVVPTERQDVVSLLDENEFRSVDLGRSLLWVFQRHDGLVGPMRNNRRSSYVPKRQGFEDALMFVVVP